MARKERFSSAPRAVGIRASQPRLSMVDRQIAALRAERERETMAIKTREELFDDLTNFSYLDPVDEYGLPHFTPYQIPDSVPDVLSMPQEDKTPAPEQITPPAPTPEPGN